MAEKANALQAIERADLKRTAADAAILSTSSSSTPQCTLENQSGYLRVPLTCIFQEHKGRRRNPGDGIGIFP